MHDRARSGAMLKIFLVDDSPLVRQRIAALIGVIKGVEIVGEAEDASDALSGIAATHADVVIVDLRLTGGSGSAWRGRCAKRPAGRHDSADELFERGDPRNLPASRGELLLRQDERVQSGARRD